ncbi:MAG: hypothetical protein WBP96_00705, partial [Nitrososphaeraceae archaeon]
FFKPDQRIATSVSGSGIATVYGDLNKIYIQKVNQIPQQIHIHLNDIINNKASAIKSECY